ncbi:acylglycerol kinase family protein [archaeon]|jgi:hypothetical protein|nr:acylglycerol kinase family protein [archaeon]MBT6762775.1 acylglycerol kinase family protein [archaeon]
MNYNLENTISVIVNPFAGSGNQKVAAEAEELCANHPAQVYATHSLIGMKQRVRRCMDGGAKVIVAVGGDGTTAGIVNEATTYSESSGIEVPKIAILTNGTGNLLKSSIGIEKLENPLETLLAAYKLEGIDALPVKPFTLVRAEYREKISKEEKLMFYTTAGVGMDAGILQDFEKVCRGKYSPLARGLVGYLRSVFGTTVWRELGTIINPPMGGVKISGYGDIRQVITQHEGVEKLLRANEILYQGPQSNLHTVLAGTVKKVGFDIDAFPHLDIKSQGRPKNPMQIRILSGPKLKVIGHLMNKTPALLMNKYNTGEYFDEYLVGEGGKVVVEYSNLEALQVAGDFISEIDRVSFERAGSMLLVDWGGLADKRYVA